nr:hypothetical protein [uncultured Actinoplanes sp.]
MAFGLPFAVTIGWTLAGPARRTAEASLPGGAGGIGAAPERPGTSQPVTNVRYQARPTRAPSASPSASAAPSPSVTTSGTVTITTSAAPTPSVSTTPPPPLTVPPVPTPTEITSEPSASTSASAGPTATPEFSTQP